MKIGIDLGGSHIGIGVVNEVGNILEKVEVDLELNKIQNIKEFIEEYITENVKKFIQEYKIDVIGVASPGTPKSGKITTLVNLGLKELNITDIAPTVITKIINEYHFSKLKENNIYYSLERNNKGRYIILNKRNGDNGDKSDNKANKNN